MQDTSVNKALKIIHHLILLCTLGYVIYLYLDLFIFVESNGPDDGFRLFTLILFVPLPLVVDILVNALIRRNPVQRRMVKIIQMMFPLLCLILTFVQFGLFSIDHGFNAFVLCLSITATLFCTSILLFIDDMRSLQKPV
ncbi:hypothetical protein [Paenibacillus sp. NPDC058071]|uniref:hypothetical protein n=1 Tax=Paenibacillus sp. NPDC058071 TaxID=3346326 RepID=UPI0036D97334